MGKPRVKRICHVVQSNYLRDPRVRREAEALAREGYDVDVIALKEKNRRRKETVNGVHITRVPLARRRATVFRYLLEYSLFFLAVSALMSVRIFTRRYDLIHINNMPDFLVFSTILPKLFGAKIVLDVHDPMSEVFKSKYGISSRSMTIRLLNWQEKISLRYCHHVLTVSEVMKERLQGPALYTPVSVALNVPDESIFQRPAYDLSDRRSHETFTLLYTGTMSARYGLAVAIDAVAQLRAVIHGLRLLLVGEGDDLPSLRDKVEQLGLQDVVEFRPPVPLSQIPGIVAECDVGISPHVNDEFMQLYFSTKVAEFVNMGLPTIVTRTHTIERYFDEDIVKYCEAGDVDSFAKAVLELYEDPAQRTRMSCNARRFSERWNWTTERQAYLSVVASLLGQSKTVQPKARALILIENLPLAHDRRVTAEAQALTEDGYHVTVICPSERDRPLLDCINGVDVYSYPAPAQGRGSLGYLWEFAYSMIASFRLARLVYKRGAFDVIHACNPPDTFFLIGKYYKALYGIPFIFDHHDISPELYSIRFNRKPGSFVYKALLWLEKCSFNAADVVLSVNESVKNLATGRGRKNPDLVYVVRNAPDLRRFQPIAPNPAHRQGRKYLVCYVGVMAAQDGLEYLIKAIDHIVNTLGRKDITFTLIGSGDRVESLKEQAGQLCVDDYIVFTGRVNDDVLLTSYLSTSDVCVAPDPQNIMNDKCSLIKIVEYMAMAKPVVGFDLAESRYTARDAAIYATPNDTAEFGDKIVELLDDPVRRKKMGENGKKRVEQALSWSHSKQVLLKAYEAALNVRPRNQNNQPKEYIAAESEKVSIDDVA